ncbi:MAG: hypothetical protein EX254_01225 [Flavobacteriaceae bacterium]|nr:hypothetical protein [Flavobacteriaceae bacterium]RZV69581.1 MAG: hypothetical protein EX254_01225 [Flavobacteriaceae bacterium]
MLHIYRLFLVIIILISCDEKETHVIADLPGHLTEVSAVETIIASNLIWVIEDSGNKNVLYGLNQKGKITQEIKISNARNEDWEDLTADKDGNIYIGDFGNNTRRRNVFAIYKVNRANLSEASINAEVISFELPPKLKREDFEAFFIHDNNFYILGKDPRKSIMIKVPNKIGDHTAELVSEFNLKGKHNSVTSADISNDGKTIVLLNHDKVWKLSGFSDNDFFSGTIESIPLDHNTQKEGVCFKSDDTIYVTDELNGFRGGNIYEYSLN